MVVAVVVVVVAVILLKQKAQVVPTPKMSGTNTAFWHEEVDEDHALDQIGIEYTRRNHYSIKLSSEGLQLPPLPLDQRTFKTSNYRKLYQNARCFADTSELLIATKHLVRNYVRKQNRRGESGADEGDNIGSGNDNGYVLRYDRWEGFVCIINTNMSQDHNPCIF